MIKNYLTIALRNLLRGRIYSVINIAGLAVGLTVFLFICLFIYHEENFDKFHDKAGRIYRIGTHLELGSNVADMTATYPPLAAAINESLPEVEKTVRLLMHYNKVFKNEDKVFTEDILYAGPEFFEVFSFNLLTGNPSLALKEKYQVVLTKDLVSKYFGASEDMSSILGKSITIEGNVCRISGVVESPPSNSYLQFKALVSMESTPQGRDETWSNMNLSTFLLLREDADAAKIEQKIPGVLTKYVKDYDQYAKQGIILRLFLQPMTSIHLHSNLQGELGPTGSMVTIYVLASVAGIVLLLACVNFMNLTTARSAKRAKEVGIRKVLGSNSRQLIRQFTFESILMVMMAALLSLTLIVIFRAPFMAILGKELSFDLISNPAFIGAFLIFIIGLGVIAGSYPSFYLASFKPAEVLKGKIRTGMGAGGLRNSLVVLQFVISIVLIASTIIVQNQLQFMRSKKLGFDKENLLVLGNAQKISSKESFLNEIRKNSGVISVSNSTFKPIDDYDGTTVVTEEDKTNVRLLNTNQVGYDYFETLKFKLVKGRGFSRDFGTDSTALVINEAGAKYLFGGDPIGKKIYSDNTSDAKEFTIVGVVADFNFETLKNEVKPLMFFLSENERFLNIRLAPGDYTKTIAYLETLWKSQNPNVPFVYSFADDDYNALFKEEAQLGNIFSVFTVLAVFIACLGLLGLAAYTAEQRTKEISIRKVMGATVTNVLLLLTRDFAKLILISIVIALPIAYYGMQEWLKGFAYRTEISSGSLILASILTLALALSIVSFQALKAALLNPAETLKYE